MAYENHFLAGMRIRSTIGPPYELVSLKGGGKGFTPRKTPETNHVSLGGGNSNIFGKFQP